MVFVCGVCVFGAAPGCCLIMLRTPPTTLEEAMEQIRRLEIKNKALSKQVEKNTSRQQHMVVTLAKIGTRIVEACDKVHVVLNEHDEQMMTDQMNAMETLIKYRGMGGGGNGQ